MPKFLITAANGNTGFPAAKELISLGHSVRAFVRNEHSWKAKELKGLGVEIFKGDMEDIRTVREALKEIDGAFFIPTYPNVLFQGSTFAIAADELQLKNVVVLSQWLSSNTHPSVYTKEHWLVDESFKRLRNANITFLNPGLFAFVYFMMPEPILQMGIMPDFGTNAPPSSEDIGMVAAHVLHRPDDHIGRTYRVTGPSLLEAQEMADIVGDYIGRKVKAEKLSESMMLKMFRSYGFPQKDASQVRYYPEDGHNGTFALNAPTNVVKEIAGKEADDFLTITQRYIGQHPLLKQTFFNKLKAMSIMIKAMATPKWDMAQYEREQGFPRFNDMKHSRYSEEWQKSHDLEQQLRMLVH